MNQPIPTKHATSIDSDPYAGDVLGRKQIGDRLTQYISRFKEGCVIAIDAPWGEGKTWFGSNWAKQLEKEKFQTIWIDAFENDQTDDPFIIISAEILAKTNKNAEPSKKFLKKVKEVGKTVLPITGKVAIGFASRALLNIDLLEEYNDEVKKSSDAAGTLFEKFIEKRLRDHDQHRKSMEGFRQTLKTLVADHEKPVVIFIDELDRCRPDYAVSVIERIKHFFDVPGLVFVLLLHRRQLEEAIKGVYGQGIDATQYLGKFVHFFMTLPKEKNFDRSARDSNRAYCDVLNDRHGLPKNDNNRLFADCFALFGSILNLSLRDIEKGYILFSLAQPVTTLAGVIAWVISLKIKYPTIFLGLLANNPDAHTEAIKVLDDFEKVVADHWFIPILKNLHAVAMGSTGVSDDTRQVLRGMHGLAPGKLLQMCAAKIDLQVTT